MKKLHKFKKYLLWILWFNVFNFLLLFILVNMIGVDLPLSEEKVNFLYDKLITAEQNYKNNTNSIDYYEDNSFKLMSYSDYKSSHSDKNICKFKGDSVIVTKTFILQYVLYHDIIDNCCYGYYSVTYNPADNTALCIYMDKSLFTINLSRTELIKTND